MAQSYITIEKEPLIICPNCGTPLRTILEIPYDIRFSKKSDGNQTVGITRRIWDWNDQLQIYERHEPEQISITYVCGRCLYPIDQKALAFLREHAKKHLE